MSDWSMSELEDIVWDGIGESDDHIVPHPACELVHTPVAQGDCHKKPRRETVTALKKSTSSTVPKNVFQGKEELSFPTLKDEKAPMLDKGSWSHTPNGVFPDFSDTEHLKEVTSLTPDDGSISENCFKNTEIDSLSNGFCEDDAVLGNKSDTIGSPLCRFPLEDISPTDDELKFFDTAHDDKESSDLLYYGWADIGNFEDVDRMFRSCDSTFGLGDAGNAGELSWLSSSSQALNNSEASLKSGFKSSSFDLSASTTTSKHCDDDTELLPDLKPSIHNSDKKSTLNAYRSSLSLDAAESASLGHSSYDSWLNANPEDNMESVNDISGRVEVKLSPAKISSGNNGMNKTRKKHTKHPHHTEGKRKDRASECTTDRSFHGDQKMNQIPKLPNSLSTPKQVIPSSSSSHQNQCLQHETYGYMGTYNPYVNANYNHPALRTPVAQTSVNKSGDNSFTSLSPKTSFASNHRTPMERSSDCSLSIPSMKSEEKMGKFSGQYQVHQNLHRTVQHVDSVGQDAFADQLPFQKQLNQSQDELAGHDAVEVGIELQAEGDSSNAPESSCMTSVLSDDFSLEATSFRQLQQVMQQLDIRTKLCIRDSLYRLARNAEQRHNFRNSNSKSSQGMQSRNKNGLQMTEESDKRVGFEDFETDTNPIDRSIAHLLFHGPQDHRTRPANDALSLESHTIIHGSITGQTVMPEKLVSEEESASGDTRLLVTDQ